MLLLFVGLIVWPFFSILSFMVAAGGPNADIEIILVHLIALTVFGVWSWYLAYKLIRLREDFHLRAVLFFAAIIAYSSIVVFGTGATIRASGPQILIGLIVANFWPALWLAYVLYSKRVNVTYGYRLHHADQFLSELGLPIEEPHNPSSRPSAKDVKFVEVIENGGYELGRMAKRLKKKVDSNFPQGNSLFAKPASRFSERIAALENAFRRGLITQEEFDVKKKEILKDL